MKSILILFCVAPIVGYCSKHFTVIVKEGDVSNESNGKTVEVFQSIKAKERIILGDQSFLVLLADNGEYFEFQGPVSVDLDHVETRGYRGTAFDYRLLYEDQYFVGSQEWEQSVHIYQPFNAENGIFGWSQVCVKWHDRRQTSERGYKIIAISISTGDTLVNEQTTSPEYELEVPMGELAVLSIHNTENEQLSIDYAVNGNYDSEHCELKSAVDNIMMGLSLELISAYAMAHKFYQKALQISNRSSIQRLVAYHNKRYRHRIEQE